MSFPRSDDGPFPPEPPEVKGGYLLVMNILDWVASDDPSGIEILRKDYGMLCDFRERNKMREIYHK